MAAPELTGRYRLIAFDLRGHGDSGTTLKPGQLTADGPEARSRLWSLDLDAILAGFRSPVLIDCPFLATMNSTQRDRITAVIADGDQIFNSAASEAVWEQAGLRTVHVPARFTQVLLSIVCLSTT